MTEQHGLLAVSADGVMHGVLAVTFNPPELTFLLGSSSYSAAGYDLFDALTTLRRSLESDGWLICCAGASRDVYPSGMSRQMSGGRAAYRHVTGRQPGQADLVDILDAVDPVEVVGVDAQLDSVRRFRGGE
jgi:hypothetical protein